MLDTGVTRFESYKTELKTWGRHQAQELATESKLTITKYACPVGVMLGSCTARRAVS